MRTAMIMTLMRLEVGKPWPEISQNVRDLATIVMANLDLRVDTDLQTFARTSKFYLCKINPRGILLRANPYDDPGEASVVFYSDDEWNYAVFPYSVFRLHPVYFLSVIEKTAGH